MSALMKQLGYVIANAPLSGLVRYAHEWPGARARVEDIGRRVVRVERPDEWFDADNEDWPDEAEVEIVMPEALVAEHGSADAAREAIAAAVRRLEREAWAEAKRPGKSFLGAERVVRVPITRRGTKWELFGARNPTFAAGGDAEATREAVARLRAFREAYRAALIRRRAGERDVV